MVESNDDPVPDPDEPPDKPPPPREAERIGPESRKTDDKIPPNPPAWLPLPPPPLESSSSPDDEELPLPPLPPESEPDDPADPPRTPLLNELNF